MVGIFSNNLSFKSAKQCQALVRAKNNCVEANPIRRKSLQELGNISLVHSKFVSVLEVFMQL